jgi:hypothetical protein
VSFIAISGAGVTSGVGSQLLQIDNSPPSAAITSPADGDRVVGLVWIVAAVSDDDRVVLVRFFLDDEELGSLDAPPYEWRWIASRAHTGDHSLTVSAEDAAGNVTVSPSIHVIVRHE